MKPTIPHPYEPGRRVRMIGEEDQYGRIDSVASEPVPKFRPYHIYYVYWDTGKLGIVSGCKLEALPLEESLLDMIRWVRAQLDEGRRVTTNYPWMVEAFLHPKGNFKKAFNRKEDIGS